MNRYSVQVTAHFEREFLKLDRQHSELRSIFKNQVVPILSEDPLNNARIHPIAKLQGIPAGQAQYRIRFERFRFRYDVVGRRVYLKACSLRNEATYG